LDQVEKQTGKIKMPIDDPASWAQGASALKTMFDSVRSAIGVLKDVKSVGGGTEEQKKTIDAALATASSTSAIAEGQFAKALGYQLCKCEFPPTPMLTVGFASNNVGQLKVGDPVYECPKCGFNNAGPFGFQRITKPSQR
jgi:hypothetical protein